jgi:methionine-S-sulfoxide reductase
MIKKIVSVVLLALVAVGATAQMNTEKATFAGGCFWCVEQAFDKVDGVIETVSGYAGGDVANPTYMQVSSGRTGHAEVLQVTYDPARVDYEHLLYVFWRNVDPLDGGGQFCDRGSQYRTGIFYHNEEQRRQAEASLKELVDSNRFSEPIRTEITQLDAFYPAEDYHQDYYKKSPARYNFYVTACGRYARLDQVWKDEARPH